MWLWSAQGDEAAGANAESLAELTGELIQLCFALAAMLHERSRRGLTLTRPF